MYVPFTCVFFSQSESSYTHAERSDMPFRGPEGIWWSDDQRYYLVGNQWVLYQGSSSESSQQLQSSQQTALTGTKLGTLSPSNVAATLRTFPQSSTTPYRQQPQLVFGENRQTLGKAAVPAITLNPNFREAASKNMMIQGFTKAMDNMANGKV
jgi:hypothetical protein